jgi:hypothetical protein
MSGYRLVKYLFNKHACFSLYVLFHSDLFGVYFVCLSITATIFRIRRATSPQPIYKIWSLELLSLHQLVTIKFKQFPTKLCTLHNFTHNNQHIIFYTNISRRWLQLLGGQPRHGYTSPNLFLFLFGGLLWSGRARFFRDWGLLVFIYQHSWLSRRIEQSYHLCCNMAARTSKKVRDQSRITFRKDFVRAELASAMNFTSAPLSELVHAERCRIKVVWELIYQMEDLFDPTSRQHSTPDFLGAGLVQKGSLLDVQHSDHHAESPSPSGSGS